MQELAPTTRRFLVPVRGVLVVEAVDGDAAYRIAEEWVLLAAKQADEDEDEAAPRVLWLRSEPESDEFPGWLAPGRGQLGNQPKCLVFCWNAPGAGSQMASSSSLSPRGVICLQD